MTDMERRTFCAALYHYGAQPQITIVFEEMAELQDVLCKFLRGRVDGDTLANIAEEIADVGIMLDQMVIEFEVEDAVAMLADSIPAADVAPVAHGRIVGSLEHGRYRRRFSCCGKDATMITQWAWPKYCPNCGAKMDGGADNG